MTTKIKFQMRNRKIILEGLFHFLFPSSRLLLSFLAEVRIPPLGLSFIHRYLWPFSQTLFLFPSYMYIKTNFFYLVLNIICEFLSFLPFLRFSICLLVCVLSVFRSVSSFFTSLSLSVCLSVCLSLSISLSLSQSVCVSFSASFSNITIIHIFLSTIAYPKRVIKVPAHK